MKKIIIDTDPGHDDALAIMLAVKSGMFDIKAITTVAGNSSIENTTRNARFVLKLLNREDIPVYSGSDRPLKRELIKAVVHGNSGLEGLDPENEPNLSGDAVEKILHIIKKNLGEITLVTLGPLTNIAKAILKDRDNMLNLKEIVIMGGAIKVPGNKNRVAEFNMFVDPEAADIVFRFPIKKTLIPLDACNNVRLFKKDFQKIENENLRIPVISMIEPYIKNIAEEEGVDGALMYDPLTVYYLINPDCCRKREHTCGMTVAELRLKKSVSNNITVVEEIPEGKFKEDFIRFLSMS